MFLLNWLLNIFTLVIVAYVVPGISFAGPWSLIITSVVLGFLNAIVRPLIILFTLPVNILTLGLFTFIINGLMFLLASSIVKGFEVTDFSSAVWGGIVYWLVTMLINFFLKNDSKKG